MKKSVIIGLTFFLFFIFQFTLANALSITRCHQYVDGACQDTGGYINYPQETTTTTEKTPQEIVTPSTQYPEPFNFIIMIFQLIGIITLFTLLIIIFQELKKSPKKKSKRR
jgi:hypothetical protein